MSITPEQRAARMAYLGGSDAAAICGTHPYKGPLEIWESKIYPVDSDAQDNAAAKRRKKIGNLVEPVVKALMEDELGIKIRWKNQTAFHPARAYMGANLDGTCTYRGERAVAEYKAIGWREAKRLYPVDEDGRPTGEVLPLVEHVFQVAHYMAAMDWNFSFIAYFVGGNDLEIIEVPRDAELEEMVLAAEYEFWHRYVLPKAPPREDNPFRMKDFLGRRFPTHTNTDMLVTADPRTMALASRVAMKRQAEKLATEEKTEAENRLKAIIGNASGLDFGTFGKATWKAHPVKRIDLDALRADREVWPLAQKYERSAPERKLLVTMKDVEF